MVEKAPEKKRKEKAEKIEESVGNRVNYIMKNPSRRGNSPFLNEVTLDVHMEGKPDSFMQCTSSGGVSGVAPRKKIPALSDVIKLELFLNPILSLIQNSNNNKSILKCKNVKMTLQWEKDLKSLGYVIFNIYNWFLLKNAFNTSQNKTIEFFSKKKE